jgi:hypothetical protein
MGATASCATGTIVACGDDDLISDLTQTYFQIPPIPPDTEPAYDPDIKEIYPFQPDDCCPCPSHKKFLPGSCKLLLLTQGIRLWKFPYKEEEYLPDDPFSPGAPVYVEGVSSTTSPNSAYALWSYRDGDNHLHYHTNLFII